MEHFLVYVVIMIGIIVGLGFFNEKVTRLTYEISLLLFSVVLGFIILAAASGFMNEPALKLLQQVQIIDLEGFLMDGVLCFMLFAGSCHMRLRDFRKHFRAISILSLLATLLGAVLFGACFFALAHLIGIKLSLPVCLLLGSIISPTDPIAATSILKNSVFLRTPASLSKANRFSMTVSA